MPRVTALLLAIMNDYLSLGYKLSLLEIEKLTYFLQTVGMSLRLEFEKGKFGPYADNLNHVLEREYTSYLKHQCKRKPATINKYIAALKVFFFAFLFAQGVVKDNSMTGIKINHWHIPLVLIKQNG